MTRHSVRTVWSLIVIASLAGCSAPTTTPTSPSAAAGGSLNLTASQLTGSWRLISIQTAGQAEQATPEGASYHLTFDNGRISTRADCNTCSGTFALSGQTLTAGPAFACTRAACPTMGFENSYTSILSGDSQVALAGDSMTLTSQRGALRFMR